MSKHNFEAETWKILELLTHSIYSNKEIFLREIISNASDAIDKARLKAVTDTTFLWDDNNFEIKVRLDKEKNIIEIEDNWIWMTEEELHKNIWTIAKSWTKDFLEKLKKAKEDWEHNLIGQFWVWFYSAFMVSDKVELETKSPLDEKAHKWISDWKSEYDVVESEKATRWTIVRLFIDEANKELLEEWKIKELVKKYSNYIWVPIMMKKFDVGNDDNRSDDKKEMEQINETKPIWKKNKTELKKEDYNEFYKSISMDFNEPLWHIHLNTEWAVSYKTILFIPKEKNMFHDPRDSSKDYGPKLYVQNVLILENAKELVPVWLRFISWVIETTDLPLNVSREMLQSNSTLEKIKKGLVKKVIAELKKLMKEDEAWYDKFLSNYREFLKEWVYYENELKEEIAELLKFDSLNESKQITLDNYLEKIVDNKENHCHNWDECCKKDDKSEDKCCEWHCHDENNCCKDTINRISTKTIYYITWKNKSEVLSSPYLEQFRQNKVDVLLLTDTIDEWLVQAFIIYKWSNLKSITSWDIKLKEETKEEVEKQEKIKLDYKDFLELTKNIIWSDKIEKVELNKNLWEFVWALKTPEWWMNLQMEKMMKAMGQAVPTQKRIFEINPENPLISMLKEEFDRDLKSEKLKEMVKYAYNQAILLEWWELENIWEFVKMTNKFAWVYIK